MMWKIKLDKKGFTLLELMVVGVIITIGVAVAHFSITALLPDLRLNAAARDLKSDINLARLRAIRANRSVIVSFNNTGGAPGSYTIAVDSDGDGDISDEPIFKQVTMLDGIELRANFLNTQVIFNSRGLVGAALGLNPNVNLKNVNNKYRRIELSVTGKSTMLASSTGLTGFTPIN